jgi:hypothetical protein
MRVLTCLFLIFVAIVVDRTWHRSYEILTQIRLDQCRSDHITSDELLGLMSSDVVKCNERAKESKSRDTAQLEAIRLLHNALREGMRVRSMVVARFSVDILQMHEDKEFAKRYVDQVLKMDKKTREHEAQALEESQEFLYMPVEENSVEDALREYVH